MRLRSTWVWGHHSVLEAIRARAALSVVFAAGRKPSPVLAEIRRLAEAQGLSIRLVSSAELDRLAPGRPTQGVAAEVVTHRRTDLSALLATISGAGRPAFLLILDQIQDPQNFGALLRTASAAGTQGVVVTERRSAPVSAVVVKVSAGAASHLPVVEVANLARALDQIRDAGVWLTGLDASARMSLFEVDLTLPIGLVLGSEGTGLRRLTRQRCDCIARLPMVGPMQSLNVAAAGSIAMYEVVRQRTPGNHSG